MTELENATRHRRRWRFGAAQFDEARWALVIDGQPASIEPKPLAVLRLLLQHPGEVVTKAELMDAVWPDVTVVEASLSTAILKLRRALHDNGENERIIETVPRIGYRLAVPVAIEAIEEQRRSPVVQATPAHQHPDVAHRPFPVLITGAILALFMVAMVAAGIQRPHPSGIASPGAPQNKAVSAVRGLDVERIHELLRTGWNPDASFDVEENGALNILLEACEWNPSHDRQRLLLVARALVDGGAQLDRRNIWGDTPLSIAAAPRYCGPGHPVTRMIRRFCYEGPGAPGDRCLAEREQNRKPATRQIPNPIAR